VKGRDVTVEVNEILETLRDTLVSAVKGRYGIAVSGSIGKGSNDASSDYDFRLYYDERADDFASKWKTVQEIIADWAKRGRIIDGVWCRSIEEIDTTLGHWLGGDITTRELEWAIWGYYLPTDIQNQMILDDPDGVLEGWKSLLSTYPPALKQAIVDKHLPFLRYWKTDYHYEHKVDTGDTVFAYSLAAKIVHAAVQLVFALNERYYVGDGKNLEFIAEMTRVPEGFAEMVEAVFYEPRGRAGLPVQRKRIVELIEAVEALVESGF